MRTYTSGCQHTRHKFGFLCTMNYGTFANRRASSFQVVPSIRDNWEGESQSGFKCSISCSTLRASTFHIVPSIKGQSRSKKSIELCIFHKLEYIKNQQFSYSSLNQGTVKKAKSVRLSMSYDLWDIRELASQHFSDCSIILGTIEKAKS